MCPLHKVREQKLWDQRLTAEWGKEQEKVQGKQNKVKARHKESKEFKH